MGASKRGGGAVRDYLEASSEKRQTAALLVVVVADAEGHAQASWRYGEVRQEVGSK